MTNRNSAWILEQAANVQTLEDASALHCHLAGFGERKLYEFVYDATAWHLHDTTTSVQDFREDKYCMLLLLAWIDEETLASILQHPNSSSSSEAFAGAAEAAQQAGAAE